MTQATSGPNHTHFFGAQAMQTRAQLGFCLAWVAGAAASSRLLAARVIQKTKILGPATTWVVEKHKGMDTAERRLFSRSQTTEFGQHQAARERPGAHFLAARAIEKSKTLGSAMTWAVDAAKRARVGHSRA